ncbi:MAG: type IV pilus modification protein PilV [Gammaproteobacteria bacterium]
MKAVLKRQSRNQHGFTMIEILIAFIILSVGVLGLAGLQGASIKSSNTAYMRTVATTQIYDFAERIRSNTKGHLLAIDGGDNVYNQLSGIPAYANCNIATNLPSAGCDTNQLAVRDIALWNTENARVLPNGQGTIRRAGQSFIITVSWDEDGLGSGFTTDGFGFPVCDPLVANTLKCVQYRIEP